MPVTTVTADADVFTCNAYLVTGDTNALVDAGAMAGVADVVRDHLDDAGDDEESNPGLDAVYLTHQHGDHVSELDAVLDAFDPALYAYADHPARTHALADGDTVQLGDDDYDVVHTPGHADDHVSLVSASTLFSGDVVVHDDGAFDDGSFGRTDYPGQSREVLIDSIETLVDRLPDTVEHMYAGHGGAFHGDVHDVVATALERAKRREPKYPDEA
jgi:hydroxyacylglutathione hydrolase